VSRETKSERSVRQDYELTQFIRVLEAAGNTVETEVLFDSRPADSSQSPPIPRKWRIDVALPQCPLFEPPHHPRDSMAWERIAIEIEGYGRHQSMKGFNEDLSKYGELIAQGWTLLRVSRQMIADGTALDLLARRGVRVEALSRCGIQVEAPVAR